MQLTSKFMGALVGMALGDAIGELAYRFPRRPHLFTEVNQTEKLIYTGDTAIVIALAESLLEKGDVEPEHIGQCFREHYDAQPHRCFGPGLPKIFKLVSDLGLEYTAAARKLYDGTGSMGNGAAMRVPPVALRYFSSTDLYQKAQLSAAVTHIHPIGTDGAAVMAKAIAMNVLAPARGFNRATYVENLAQFATTAEIRTKMLKVGELSVNKAAAYDAAQQLGRSITVQESMPFAIFCFINNAEDFVETIGTAISNGGDSNTLGAMAGALSGAYLGIEGIPAAWRAKIENLEIIESLAQRLYKQIPQPQQKPPLARHVST